MTALEGYPFESHYFKRPDGLALHYIDEGQGNPVIMVHGNPSWSFLWRHLIKDLSKDFRCLAPDHMGMGLSSKPLESQYSFRLAERIGDLKKLIASWNLERPAHLIVHDWGGPIGLGWAVSEPEKIASICIMNSGTRIPPQYQLPLKLNIFKRGSYWGKLLAQKYNLFCWGTATFGVSSKLTPEAYKGFLAPYQKAEDRLAVAKFIEDIPLEATHPSYDTLNGIDKNLAVLADKPISLIWGLEDFVFNRHVFLDWQERFPQAEFLALPQAGHYLMEDEKEAVCAFVRKFIS